MSEADNCSNEIKKIAESINNKSCVCIIGAGVSRQKKYRSKEYKGISTGSELFDKLKTELGNSDIRDFSDACTMYEKNNRRNDLIQFLDKYINIKTKPLPAHKMLAKLNITHYISFNFDTLLEEALRNENKEPITIMRNENLIRGKNGKVTIIKPHGSIDDTTTLCVTTSDIKYNYQHRIPLIWNQMISLLLNNTILILGYSLTDKDFIDDLLNYLKNLLNDYMPNIYVVLSPELSESQQSFYEGFTAVHSSIKKIHKDLTEFLEELTTQVKVLKYQLPEEWWSNKFFRKVDMYGMATETEVIDALLKELINRYKECEESNNTKGNNPPEESKGMENFKKELKNVVSAYNKKTNRNSDKEETEVVEAMMATFKGKNVQYKETGENLDPTVNRKKNISILKKDFENVVDLILKDKNHYFYLEEIKIKILKSLEDELKSENSGKLWNEITKIKNDRNDISRKINEKADKTIEQKTTILLYSQSSRVLSLLESINPNTKKKIGLYIAECGPRCSNILQEAISCARQIKASDYKFVRLCSDITALTLLEEKKIDLVLMGVHEVIQNYRQDGKEYYCFINTCGTQLVVDSAIKKEIDVKFVYETHKCHDWEEKQGNIYESISKRIAGKNKKIQEMIQNMKLPEIESRKSPVFENLKSSDTEGEKSLAIENVKPAITKIEEFRDIARIIRKKFPSKIQNNLGDSKFEFYDYSYDYVMIETKMITDPKVKIGIITDEEKEVVQRQI